MTPLVWPGAAVRGRVTRSEGSCSSAATEMALWRAPSAGVGSGSVVRASIGAKVWVSVENSGWGRAAGSAPKTWPS